MKQIPTDGRYFNRHQYRVLRLPDDVVRVNPAWMNPFSDEDLAKVVPCQ